ncbi:Type I secretion membrane fusion protein, HlyD [Nitrobacter hamburgensis X14]|uniref:Membrane fusion protein (MFP) family protein n=1 Tax=Nitrobacter hamburgensis (strain DSM 10229 / NCIMB 13809 / X14) TaxID=323097 RepID=Q1QJ82_NITHX|nr:HlyD family type I secretion periplasmic adaptor subunit [Nitrobacter hamburgensis]ABE63715.1 Type I secretion membrane fusion protein, HlyD [Nitrobacter hamburgensis X14]
MSTTMTGDQPWHVDLPRSTRGHTIAGMVIIATTIMGFGVWGNTAPIAGAVVASGVFVATGQNKTIQHLEGGVISDIMVHEGDTVEPGQILVKLDRTTAKAEMQRLFLRNARLTAVDARLQAQVREEAEVNFPPDLAPDSKDPQIRSIVSAQLLAFTAQRNNTNSEIAGIEDSIKALNERIAGSKVQLAGVRRQIALVEEDIKTKEHLLAAGLVRKPDVLLLQRNQANLEGEVGRIMGDIGDAKERIARAVEQINGVRKTAIKTAVEQMHEARGELVDVRERMLSARGVLDRTTIRAPVKGVVVKLRFHTRGGVVEPGKPIMELLPLNEPLIIEARVRPQDIDSVKHGQEAMVRLTALSQRVTPMVSGDVIYLSADTVADEKKSQQLGPSDIYVVRVRLHNSEVAAIHGFNPTPGMPAEVFIKTSERTFFQYIMKPIEDSMSRAFRER